MIHLSDFALNAGTRAVCGINVMLGDNEQTVTSRIKETDCTKCLDKELLEDKRDLDKLSKKLIETEDAWSFYKEEVKKLEHRILELGR